MLRWELKKIIFSKIFIISLILIIAFRLYDVLKMWNRGDEYRTSNGLFEELYLNEDEYNDYAIPYYQNIKNADVAILMNTEGMYLENAFADMQEIKALVNAKKYSKSTYEVKMVDLVKKAARKVDGDSSKYEVRYYSKYIDTYNQRVEVEPVNNIGEYLNIIFSGKEIPFAIMLVWVTVMTAYVVKGQERKRFQGIYMTTPNGRRKGILTKLAAFGIILVALELLCFVALIINAVTMYGFSFRVLFSAVQSAPEYMYCPIHTSVIGIIFISYVVKIIVYLMFMCITALIAYFIKAIPAILVSVLSGVLPVFLLVRMDKATYEASQLYSSIRQYFPPLLIDYSEYIIDFDYARLFNFPVSRMVCVITVAFFVIMLCIVLLILFAEKKNMEMGYGIKSRKNK